MIISFKADSFFNEDDGDVIYGALQGFKGGEDEDMEHFLNFQKSVDGDMLGGIYLEYNGQENGGYDNVKLCELTRDKMTLQLAKQLGDLQDVEGFDVSLDFGDDIFNDVKEFLTRIFEGYEELLKM